MGTLQVLRNATLILAFLVSGVLAETLHFDRFYRQTIGSPGLSHFAYYAFFKKDGTAQVFAVQSREDKPENRGNKHYRYVLKGNFFSFPSVGSDKSMFRPKKGKLTGPGRIEIVFETETGKETSPVKLEIIENNR